MKYTVYLLTPPFTQLNTPYPATAYLKGFFNTRQISSFQSDLGLEVTLELFSEQGLNALFAYSAENNKPLSENASRIQFLKNDYISTIKAVIRFLQGSNPTMAYLIASRNYLPEAGRFAQMDDLQWAFGSMGIQDKAKHVATMYLEDLADFIKEAVDEHFGFSRYAEKLGRSANSFDELYNSLQCPLSFIDTLLVKILEERIHTIKPKLVAISVPFPGNLFAAFRCAQWIRKFHPDIKVAMGGGFANTELRSLSDARVFEFFHFITLDDGEAPLENLVGFLESKNSEKELKRTFLCKEGTVEYINNTQVRDYRQGEVGTPDYSDLLLDKYISAIEVVNPMHRLWSDGRWNKLTMAHGCYWGKCTFCDISLDYIKLYEPVAASLLCDRIETLIEQTGQNGFHFVDEAAPPALMRALAIEILKRNISISWWTNIRFEKSFTRDLCLLLKASGCIAVSGGLEVASDRLLELIQKGITVSQVAAVNKNFSDAGIMVHAYLMYGFPTQTDQETIDSLEMVRQLFKAGVMQSAFWHLFTMTAHSPVGMDPKKYKVSMQTDTIGTFANNDIQHLDPTGANHEEFSFGLRKSLFNYMQGIGLEEPLGKWFEFKVPKTKVPPDYINTVLKDDLITNLPSAKVIWTGNLSGTSVFTQTKKGNSRGMLSLTFQTKKKMQEITVPFQQGEWLAATLHRIAIQKEGTLTLSQIKEDYEKAGLEDFELFWDNKPVNQLYKMGLYIL